jgi:Cft2 family RNA processing exonuclease
VISDHADWDGLCATITATGAGEIWVTHGQEDALVHWCQSKGLKARRSLWSAMVTKMKAHHRTRRRRESLRASA